MDVQQIYKSPVIGYSIESTCTLKPVLSNHSKIDNDKIVA